MSPHQLIRTSLFLTVTLFCSNSMRVGRSEGFSCHVHPHLHCCSPSRADKKVAETLQCPCGPFQSLRIFGIIVRLRLPHARNEVYNGLDGFILLQLFCFSPLFPLVPRGPLVGGYPVDSNVNGRGIHPPGASAGKGIFVLDVGTVKGDGPMTRRSGSEPKEMRWAGRFSKQPSVRGGGNGDDGVGMTFLWHGFHEHGFWDAVMC